MKGLKTLDWLVIAGYFVILGGVAIWLGWFVVGASIFASDISPEQGWPCGLRCTKTIV
jgi:hypothetical protein